MAPNDFIDITLFSMLIFYLKASMLWFYSKNCEEKFKEEGKVKHLWGLLGDEKGLILTTNLTAVHFRSKS